MSTITPYPNETNPLLDGGAYHARVHQDDLLLRAFELRDAGGRFTRIRLLTEPGYPLMDVSYVHGTLPDGRVARIVIDFENRLPRRTYRSALQDSLIRDCGLTRQDCNRMGVWDEGCYSVMR